MDPHAAPRPPFLNHERNCPGGWPDPFSARQEAFMTDASTSSPPLRGRKTTKSLTGTGMGSGTPASNCRRHWRTGRPSIASDGRTAGDDRVRKPVRLLLCCVNVSGAPARNGEVK